MNFGTSKNTAKSTAFKMIDQVMKSSVILPTRILWSVQIIFVKSCDESRNVRYIFLCLRNIPHLNLRLQCYCLLAFATEGLWASGPTVRRILLLYPDPIHPQPALPMVIPPSMVPLPSPLARSPGEGGGPFKGPGRWWCDADLSVWWVGAPHCTGRRRSDGLGRLSFPSTELIPDSNQGKKMA